MTVHTRPVKIEIYLEKEVKELFQHNCFKADTNMSREIRRFIREFNRNPPKDDRLYYSSPKI